MKKNWKEKKIKLPVDCECVVLLIYSWKKINKWKYFERNNGIRNVKRIVSLLELSRCCIETDRHTRRMITVPFLLPSLIRSPVCWYQLGDVFIREKKSFPSRLSTLSSIRSVTDCNVQTTRPINNRCFNAQVLGIGYTPSEFGFCGESRSINHGKN